MADCIELSIEQYMPNKEDVLKHFGVEGSWDYALPQGWFDDFMERTGVNPLPFFVWMYRDGSAFFGEPFPISPKGIALLNMYNGAVRADASIVVRGLEG